MPPQNNGNPRVMGEFSQKILLTLAGVLLVYVIVWFGTLIRNNVREYQFIGNADRMERTITVEGEGKVAMQPDVAQVVLGAMTEAETVEVAQTENTRLVNNLMDALEEMGVATEDIQTQNYNVYPRYDYTEDDGRVLDGYEVSQNVQVKVRDVAKAGDVISLAGRLGLNSVGGLNFIIDDTDVYTEEARQKAIEDAIHNARLLATQLGVRLGGIVAYNEYENSPMPLYRTAYAMDEMSAMGGAPSPIVEPGSEEVVVAASLTFGIK